MTRLVEEVDTWETSPLLRDGAGAAAPDRRATPWPSHYTPDLNTERNEGFPSDMCAYSVARPLLDLVKSLIDHVNKSRIL